MRRFFALTLLLLCPVLVGGQSRNQDPEAAQLVYADIPRFWEAWDAARQLDTPAERAAAYDRLYLAPGTPGLRAFTRMRIDDAAQLAATIDRHPNYYAQLRSGSLKLHRQAHAIRRSLRRLAQLYPQAVFPDVYFLIGRMNSGGTQHPDGLLIGVDMFGLDSDTPTTELGDWHRAVIKPMAELPHIVAHEWVHYQQRYALGEKPSLLQVALVEGIADLLAELGSGRHINEHVHAWAEPRARDLWREFRERMHGSELKGWLYDTVPGDGRPADLGYWMGYRIARAYYDRADDKRAAIERLLTIEDFDAFLIESGAVEQFEREADAPR